MKKNGADIIRSLFSQNKGLKGDQMRTNLVGWKGGQIWEKEDQFGK